MTTAKKTSSTAIKRIRGDVVFDVVNAGILIVMMLVVLYPLIYVVSCSVSSPLLVVQSKVVLFPKGMTKVAYEHVFNNSLILSGYGNTILYTLIGTSINLVMTIMAAFPLSQKTFGARKGITFLFTFTMLFSGGLVPTFLTVQRLGLMDTVWALVLPGAISAWNMLIMKNYFQTSIPGELYEAARIDGADLDDYPAAIGAAVVHAHRGCDDPVLRRFALELLFQRPDLSARSHALSVAADHAQLFLRQ